MINRIIYLTHCSSRKNASLKGTNRKVTPDVLYTSNRIQRFMRTCVKKDVNWAIFSDKYGICYKNTRNSWYEKAPDGSENTNGTSIIQ